ncbi:unnamed protein product, partial [Ectocarpus sp. 13 AM-2016]
RSRSWLAHEFVSTARKQPFVIPTRLGGGCHPCRRVYCRGCYRGYFLDALPRSARRGRLSREQGLAPVFVDPKTGLFGESGGTVGTNRGLVTLGARGDSYYEYLLKQWLFSGKK